MSFSPLIDDLVNAFRALPGVGQKSAQRMVLHILEKDRHVGKQLSGKIIQAINNIQKCLSCHNLSEGRLCNICNNSNRDKSIICVVERPSDVIAIEQTSSFNGVYFVLMGHLSPIDGIGPSELGIDDFINKLDSTNVTEVILATSSTVEGEATAYYISQITKKRNIRTTKIAYGIPLGSELEHIDMGTILRAISARELV